MGGPSFLNALLFEYTHNRKHMRERSHRCALCLGYLDGFLPQHVHVVGLRRRDAPRDYQDVQGRSPRVEVASESLLPVRPVVAGGGRPHDVVDDHVRRRVGQGRSGQPQLGAVQVEGLVRARRVAAGLPDQRQAHSAPVVGRHLKDVALAALVREVSEGVEVPGPVLVREPRELVLEQGPHGAHHPDPHAGQSPEPQRGQGAAGTHHAGEGGHPPIERRRQVLHPGVVDSGQEVRGHPQQHGLALGGGLLVHEVHQLVVHRQVGRGPDAGSPRRVELVGGPEVLPQSLLESGAPVVPQLRPVLRVGHVGRHELDGVQVDAGVRVGPLRHVRQHVLVEAHYPVVVQRVHGLVQAQELHPGALVLFFAVFILFSLTRWCL
ncbi:hypothetical protein [Cyprinid herpesvirus 3]|uniref:Uncharacterized protein n=1 Tax=Cyprinid herpesvirus 3 TaxID=180230 RepID=A4FTH1_CYHV3|nr:hypothetical protein [Cyprinid herpesvirus 3]